MERLSTVLIAAPVRNRETHLPQYLEGLRNLQYPKDRIGFFFLVNDSTDKSLELLRDFKWSCATGYRECVVDVLDLGTVPDRRKWEARKKVYKALATLRNRILDYFENSDYDYLFSVDSDIYVKPNVLERLMSHQKPFVAAMISNMPKKMVPNAMVRSRGDLRRFYPPEGEAAIYEVAVTGAVGLMTREVLGSRYAWSKQGEDIPFCDSLRERGIKIYLDTAPVAKHDMR